MTSEEAVKVPAGWKYVTISSVVKESKNGFASGERDENGIVQLRMNNVTTDGNIIFEKYLKVPIPHNIDFFILKEGDFLFNNTNSIDLVGKSAIYKEQKFKCTYSNHFTRIRFDKDKVIPELVLYHTLKLWRTGTLRRFAIRHVGQAAIHHSYLLKRKILLPPLPEQHKIASILSKVDEHISHTEAIIEKTEELKKGLMQQLLTKGIGHTKFKKTEIGEIPEEWDVNTLEYYLKEGVIESHLDGNHGAKYPRPSEFVKSGVPYISANSLFLGGVDFSKAKYLTPERAETITKGIAKSGDILLAHNATVGPIALLDTDFPKVILSTSLTYYRCNSSKIFNKYLKYYMESILFQKQLESIMKQTTRNQVPITTQRKLYFCLPPLSEQQKIGEILFFVDSQLSQNQTYLSHLQELKTGLMQDLLTGKVRVTV